MSDNGSQWIEFGGNLINLTHACSVRVGSEYDNKRGYVHWCAIDTPSVVAAGYVEFTALYDGVPPEEKALVERDRIKELITNHENDPT